MGLSPGWEWRRQDFLRPPPLPPLPPSRPHCPQDGRNWARIEADHHTGALFDVGASGEHDELHVNSTQASGLGAAGGRLAI